MLHMTHQLILSTGLFTLAFSISALTIPLLKRVAWSLNIVDHPGERKIHTVATPLLGGIAVLLGFYGTILLALVFVQSDAFYPLFYQRVPDLIADLAYLDTIKVKLLAFALGGLLIASVGLLDDKYGPNFSFHIKLLVQLAVALGLVCAGIRTTIFPGELLDYLISTLWLVGITNSFNLLDNMDGLTSGVAITSGILFLFVALIQGQWFIALTLVTFLGAISAFLCFNFPPASIFLGDAGSLFIGYTLAALSLLESFITQPTHSVAPVVIPLLIMGLPIFDTFSVIVIRLKQGRPIYKGDKSHLSHRLISLGLAPRRTLLVICLIALAMGLEAPLIPRMGITGIVLLVAHAAIISLIVTILMILGERRRTPPSSPKP